MTRILVTGGAGYIGSTATYQLLQRGYEVTVFDDLSTGHRDAVDGRAHFCEGSLLNTDEIFAALKDVSAVMHFGGKSLVGESVQKPQMYFENNVHGSQNLLDAMKSAGVKKIVFSSSAATYGSTEISPITENLPTHPTNPYGETKAKVDEMLTARAIVDGFDAISLRYFNVAGALHTSSGWLAERHQPETHLIPNVLKATEDNPLKIFGTDWPTPDGTCVRDYIHVVDLIDAHILACEWLSQPGHEIVNLGSGSGYSVREIIAKASEVLGAQLPYEEIGRREGDPATLVASIKKAQRLLGWTPKKSLEEMIGDAHHALSQ
jgi:UDP-glucose 4-epimerase